MALPGLAISHTVPIIEAKPLSTQDLKPNTEWRFEVAFGETIEVKLLTGTAEMFGTELAQNQPYNFTGKKAAIYTWHGCKLEVNGRCQIDYVAEETPMSSYANLHFAVEQLRDAAAERHEMGPRVLIVGPENAGKTSLVRLLASYATRSGRRPIVANLDPKEGMLTVPGTISAVALESILDVEEGWGSSPTNGPSQVPVKLPLVYYYGIEDPESEIDLFKPLVTRLALSVINKVEDDALVKQTGCIIDTSGSVSNGKGNYEIIQHAVAEFSVNVLVVLGSERLFSDMTRRFGSKGISVVKLDKSGGCVDRDQAYLQQMRQAQTREYFFGDANSTLSPHAQHVDFAEITIYRVPDKNDLLDSFLPGGDPTSASDTDPNAPSSGSPLEPVAPTPMMQGSILAIVAAEPADSPEVIRDASVIGFVYVAEVDEKRKRLRLLAPLSERVPRKAVIWGAWPEGVGELA